MYLSGSSSMHHPGDLPHWRGIELCANAYHLRSSIPPIDSPPPNSPSLPPRLPLPLACECTRLPRSSCSLRRRTCLTCGRLSCVPTRIWCTSRTSTGTLSRSPCRTPRRRCSPRQSPSPCQVRHGEAAEGSMSSCNADQRRVRPLCAAEDLMQRL